MTIGKSSRKSAKSPKFLDRASGFYGRLDDTKAETAGGDVLMEQNHERERTGKRNLQNLQGGRRRLSGEPSVFDFDGGVMEDDGKASLLRKKPSRDGGRWRRRRSSSGKRVDGQSEVLPASKENQIPASAREALSPLSIPAEEESHSSPAQIHFSIGEDGDDQAPIWKKKRGKELDVQHGEEVKLGKRSTLRSYRRAIDRAFRRGWETFIANLNSVTLAPISSSSSHSSSPAGFHQNSAIAEYR
ncbi:uncharacterized protein LOC108925359 [Scleropages formosus]|uniref:uncharacterized protein LOC108925359 n=1 Tax=Scleropages formosus TaxID=113540 RepID=UPI000878337E|nr:uncharacterized protein LOC108925359 [Scleropages formosus]XP_018592728.1 uncharacterized protein LOC108925359 [Scleropages formosus]